MPNGARAKRGRGLSPFYIFNLGKKIMKVGLQVTLDGVVLMRTSVNTLFWGPAGFGFSSAPQADSQ